MTEIVERLRAGYAGDAPFPFDRAPMALTVEPIYLVRDHNMREIAASLAAKDKEIERLREEGLVKDSAIIEAAKLAKKLMTRAVQAEQEHTDMMWQRRRADERAEQAERALAEAVEILTIWSHDGSLQTFEHREKFREGK